MVQWGRTLDIVLIVLGSVFVALAIVAVCIGVAVFRRRRRAKRRTVSPVFDSPLTPQHLVFDKKRESSRSNGAAVPSLAGSRKLHRPNRIQIPSISQMAAESNTSLATNTNPNAFQKRVIDLKKNDFLLLYEEFDTLNRQTYLLNERRTTMASESNMKKNRFPDVLPFDHNRVKLTAMEDSSDFINASFIMSHDEVAVQFIAAQGPIGPPENVSPSRENTVDDFWEMIWQERVQCGVMLTQCIEHLKLKCAEYWPRPLGSSLHFGPICVTLVAETEYATALMRTFDVTKGDETRSFTQFHFEQWLDAKGPESVDNLLCLVTRVKEGDYQGPVLIHCSAGIGRTGVFIALWQIISGIESDPTADIDVFSRVRRLREQRIRMVQSAEQYASLYEAVALFLSRRGVATAPTEGSLSGESEDSRYEVQEVSAV